MKSLVLFGDSLFGNITKAEMLAQLEQRLKQHYVANPGSKKYSDDEGQVYFSVSPTWIRYTDLTNDADTYAIDQFEDMS